jgi:glycosyltransferase involved in cell wall biosynthesis
MADKLQDPDISVVLTAHREGVLAGATANSARRAIARAATDLGLVCEVILVLDRANDATSIVLEHAFNGICLTVLKTDEGDPGQARNAGIAVARAPCATFLDGDDLVSENWLTEAHRLIAARPDCIGQSHCNMVFGNERNLWWHIDSEGPLFDPEYLNWGNYWDAMTFARTEIYRRFPFRRNDLKLGFGHEDWHWNAWTISEGVAHKPVPETMHFKRRRTGSQSALVEQSGSSRWPLGI